MFNKETLGHLIYIDDHISRCESIGCRIIKDADNTVAVVFEKVNDDSDYIYKVNGGKSIATPSFLRPFIGGRIIQYVDPMSSNVNELFRIKPIDFELNGLPGIKYQYPYFTSGQLVIPWLYISECLDEKVSVMRASFVSNSELVIEQGLIRAEFIPVKNGYWNYPLYKSSNGLRTRSIVKFMDWISNYNKILEHFKYIGTIDVSYNKYGVMVFKEEVKDE